MSRTRIAFVSLMDCNGHWLKSQVGLDQTFTHNYLNFCALAIGQNAQEFNQLSESNSEVDIIGDASTDQRFATHALVASYPSVTCSALYRCQRVRREYFGQKISRLWAVRVNLFIGGKLTSCVDSDSGQRTGIDRKSQRPLV